ncbi:hypothetical protein G7K_4906-t1 [Saitoella complicata NRRL Y-17804]|uniref:Uncharacterized protein n=1 Tax=Saitoella complicata (strain BCRC 22490 / CBS 7301 / JCM 7358 / NBRC 10748 / NRRL Y-17804) TaxID=698492 RepID=A0A0E9NMY6_SAICN|nr:hypothetical protein G7K_4906-t1 [Saitoella complicata NRRL Y-17804]
MQRGWICELIEGEDGYSYPIHDSPAAPAAPEGPTPVEQDGRIAPQVISRTGGNPDIHRLLNESLRLRRHAKLDVNNGAGDWMFGTLFRHQETGGCWCVTDGILYDEHSAEQALTEYEFKGNIDPQPWFVRKRKEVAYEDPGTPSVHESYYHTGDEDDSSSDTSSTSTIRGRSKDEDEDEDENEGEDNEEQTAAARQTLAKHLHERAVESGFATTAPVGNMSSTFASHARPLDDKGFQRVMRVNDPNNEDDESFTAIIRPAESIYALDPETLRHVDAVLPASNKELADYLVPFEKAKSLFVDAEVVTSAEFDSLKEDYREEALYLYSH